MIGFKKIKLREILNNKYVIFIIILLLIFLIIFLYKEYFIKKKLLINLNTINSKILKQKKFEKVRYQEKIDFINKFLKDLDLKTDNSLTKFVSAKVPFNNKGYIPNDLVYISGKYIIDGKGGGQRLRKESNNALEKMGKKYFEDTGKKIVVVSAYRSYLYQKGIKDRGCPDNLCAKAGYSEHQSGLAVDLWAASSNSSWQSKIFKQRYKWLKENAYKFGFTNTYQKGLKIDTYEIEPWHWRYVGIKLAKYLLDNNLTLAEFYNKMESN